MADRAAARDLAVLLGSALAAAFVAVIVIRPLAAVQVGFDTAASVIHFQRLVAGERLEAFVTTTPKPLVTLVDGVLHAIGGWAAVAWAAIAMHGLATGLAALLALRVAGVAAAAFVAVALAGNAFLLVETSFAYAVPWAVALWCGAGLAVTATPPRYSLAGAALLLATLARVETLVLVGVIALALLVGSLVRRRGSWRDRVPAVPGRAWTLVAIPALALPIMLVHDWLLTGDPTFWLTVSQRYTEAARARAEIAGPAGVAASLAGLVAAQGLVAVLAVVGLVGSLVRRSWPVVVGLVALGPGMIAFLLLLAFRGTYVSGRYGAPIELSVLFAAGVAVGLIVETLLGRLRMDGGRPIARGVLRVGAAAIAAVVAISLAGPWGPSDEATVDRIANERRLQANAAAALPVISRELDARPGSRDPPPPTAGVTVPSGRPPLLLVSGLLRPRLAVDLGLPVDLVAGLDVGSTADRGQFTAGQIVYFDLHAGRPSQAFTFLVTEAPVERGGLRFIPIHADPDRGAFVHVVQAR